MEAQREHIDDTLVGCGRGDYRRAVWEVLVEVGTNPSRAGLRETGDVREDTVHPRKALR